MRIVFVSNYINHHQTPICGRLAAHYGEDEFAFIQTQEIEADRLAMGWSSGLPSYVREAYKSPEENDACRKLIMDADVVIFGGCEDESYIAPRLEAGKPTLRYSERVYKDGQWKFITPRGLVRKYNDHTKYAGSPVYLLCSGAYVASDFSIFKAYPDKMLKWGYFPELSEVSFEELLEAKSSNEVPVLMWAGRFLDWKRTYLVLDTAAYLKGKNIPFHIDIVGNGPLEEELISKQKEMGLADAVTFHGPKTPDEVREMMKKTDIYLVTSDRHEGWGAVINEAMNMGCAVVSDADEGATPYLLKQGVNGYIFSVKEQNGPQGLFEKTEKLLTDSDFRKKLAENAYNTIRGEWNPVTASDRLIKVMDELRDTGRIEKSIVWESGPLSREIPRKEKQIRSEVLSGE